MARPRTPRKDPPSGTRGVPLKPKLIALSVAAAFALSLEQASANPTGPTVVSGSAAFAAQGNALTITNSANAIITWQGFSISANELTRFIQPSQLSAVLNRVIGAGGTIPQSVINGVLSSNGQVYLLNPNGIVIGANARIDVAGLVASSLDLSNADFLAGKLKFNEVPGAGAIQNQGTIDAGPGGRVYLVGSSVENSGIIRSPGGEVVLAAGKSVELVSEYSPNISVRITASDEQAKNLGTIIADSGRIGLHGAIVTQGGIAEASGAVVGPGGEIRLVGTKDVNVEAGSLTAANGVDGGKVVIQAETGTAEIRGTVEATGSSGKGGTVQALGVRVGVLGNGIIDASGDSGGGTVLVGGDYQGKNPDVQNSQQTVIGSDGVIRADARDTGNGGRVIAWSDGDTAFYGKISARGGANGGDGGVVETSGKRNLQAFGRVDVSAPKGTGGNWLLDPYTINIVDSGGDMDSGNISDGGSIPYYEYGSSVSVGAIQSAIYGGSVGLQAQDDGSGTQGNVNFNFTAATLDLTASNPSSYDFQIQAAGNINTNAKNVTNTGGVSFEANHNGFPNGATGTGSITGGGAITSVNRPVTLVGQAISVGNVRAGNSSSTNQDIVIRAYGGSVVAGNLDTYSGDVDVRTDFGGSVAAGNITTRGGMVWVAPGTSGVYAATVNVGAIDTRALDTCCDSGDVWIYSQGNLTVNGNILTRSTESTYEDSDPGDVTLTSYGGRVQVNGAIDTSGQDAVVYDFGAYAANGGDVNLWGQTGVQTGNITTRGGRGADGYYAGGLGGWIYAQSPGGGPVTLGNLDTRGGASDTDAGFGTGTDGGWSGVIQIYTNGPVQVGNVTTRGGNAGPNPFGSGYQGGEGGSIIIEGNSPAASIGIGTIDVSGGNGGSGSAGYGGGMGGHAGWDVEFTANSISAGSITGNGGNGGSGSTGGPGGDGSFIGLYSDGPGPVNAGNLIARGGSGGTGTAGSGGNGGDGGVLEVGCDSCVTYPFNIPGNAAVGAVDVSGGNGGAGTTGGGWGGSSYYVGMSASMLSFASVNANGGVGGSGAIGGYGGSAAFIVVYGAPNPGPIAGMGGNAGGGGAAYGGPGSFLQIESPGAVALNGVSVRGGINGDGTESPSGYASVRANGGVTQGGPINVGGYFNVETTAPGDVVLTNPANFIPSFSAGGSAPVMGSLSLATSGIANPYANVWATGNIALQNLTPSGTYQIYAMSDAGSVSAISDSVLVLSASSPTLFEWYSPNSAPIGVNQSFFDNISAPMVKVGNSLTSSPITLSGAISLPGTLSLITNGGLITQSGGGLTAGALNADGGNVLLTDASNQVGVLQGRATGTDFQFTSSGNIALGTADPGNVTPGVTSNGYVTLASLGGSILGGGGATYDVAAPVVQLSASNSIGTPATPLQVRATQLDASAETGIDLVTNQYNPQMVSVTTLENLFEGNINLSAYGGASLQNEAFNAAEYGGNVTIETFSPLEVLNGIDAFGDILLITGGASLNDMYLDGSFIYSPRFKVVVGPGGFLLLGPNFRGPITEQIGGRGVPGEIFTQISQTTGEINNSVNFDSTTGPEGDDEKDKKDRKLPVCKG